MLFGSEEARQELIEAWCIQMNITLEELTAAGIGAERCPDDCAVRSCNGWRMKVSQFQWDIVIKMRISKLMGERLVIGHSVTNSLLVH